VDEKLQRSVNIVTMPSTWAAQITFAKIL